MRYTRKNIPSKTGNTFKFQLIFCAVLLVAASIVKMTSDDVLVKTKKAITLILTEQTGINKEFEKVKSIFLTDDSIESLNPVSEFMSPAEKCSIVKGFGVQDAEESGFNYGVDLKVNKNENILAVADGEITEIATTKEYGTYILIKHSDELFTMYAQLNEILPDVGEKVSKGQTIGRANEETSTIHFEIRRNDTYLDPTEFIDFGEKND